MTIKDVLFKQTLVRVGPEQMKGVERLLEGGHTGIAEKHTVQKLLMYVKALEAKLGIAVPDPIKGIPGKRFMKINDYKSGSYFIPSVA